LKVGSPATSNGQPTGCALVYSDENAVTAGRSGPNRQLYVTQRWNLWLQLLCNDLNSPLFLPSSHPKQTGRLAGGASGRRGLDPGQSGYFQNQTWCSNRRWRI